MSVNVKIKKLSPESQIPFYATDGSAGMDITAISVEYDSEHDRYIYHTGLAFQLPAGYFMYIMPRSSNTKTEGIMLNSPGLLDTDYRGELLVCYKNRTAKQLLGEEFVANPMAYAPYTVGARIAQIMILPYPKINFIETDELDETNRGSGGFGSTGN